MKSNIKFIYFDVGGVVIADFSNSDRWNELLQAIGIDTSNKDAFDKLWNRYKDRVCIDYDVDSMIPQLSEIARRSYSEDFSFLDEFIDRFSANQSIWQIIKNIRVNFGIGLLTNMYPRMFDKIMAKEVLLPKISWDVIVDSSVVRLQKPSTEIFTYAEKACGYKGSEILFIDNSKEHLRAAEQLGWQTFLYDSSNYDIASQNLSKFIQSLN